MKFFPPIHARLNSNRRGAISIFAGIAAGQVLALLAAPLLSRIYSPSDFGVFATCSAIIVTIGTVASVRFELAIPLPAHDREAYGLVVLGLLSATLLGFLCTVAVALGGGQVASALGQPQLMPWLWVVPPGATAMGYYLVLNQLAIRQRRFIAIGRRSFLQSATIVVSQIIAGLAGLRPGGLVAGFGIGQAMSAVSLLAGSGIRSKEGKAGRDRALLRSLVVRYRRFPLVLGPSGLLNVLGLQLPIILMAAWYGGEVAGWMGLTQRILALPVTLIGTTVAQVYLSELARQAREGLSSAAVLFRRVSLSLLFAGTLLLLALLFLGPTLFKLIFGLEWTDSGQYAQALAFGLAAQLVASPVSQTLIVLERPILQFVSDATRVIVVFVVVFAVKYSGGDALTAIWAIGISLGATYVLSWILSWRSLMTVAAKHESD